jgi:WD40 repeat protein
MNVAATNSAVYGLTTKARCLSAITAESESDKIRFLVGTCVLKEENEVHLVELQEDENEIKCLSIYNHQSEIWSLEPSPQDASLFFTTYTVNNGSNMKASLWKIKEEERNGVLEEVMQLQTTDNADIRRYFILYLITYRHYTRVIWNPEGGERNSILSTDANNIRIWNLNSSNTASISSQLSIGELQTISSVTWNPLHNEQLASSNESSIRGWDLRTKK